MFDRATVLLVLVCAGGSVLPVRALAAELPLEPQSAQFVLSNTPTPPAVVARGWQARAIPDSWRRTQPHVGGIGWYLIPVVLDTAPTEPWAIYLVHRATVYVNGAPVGGAADLIAPIAGRWYQPVLFIVPPKLLHAGTNEVLIGTQSLADTTSAGLHGVLMGPERLLRGRYQIAYFLRVTLPQALVVVCLVMAVLFALLWLRRRKDTIYGWFALGCVVWAGKPLFYLVRDPSLDGRIWIWAIDTHLYWMSVLTLVLAHRFFRIHRPWIEYTMFACALAMTTVLFPFYRETLRNLLIASVVLFAVYVLGVVAWHAWRTRRTEDVAFALALVIQITLGLHDFLLQLDVLQHQQWYLVHYGSSALCLVLGWMLTRRFVYALDAAEATGADLVRQVEQKRQELELSYRHMHELEQQHAVAEERERIMRDLHDGLGGQLVAALALTRSGVSGQPAIEQTLRDALDDLRVVIDSLDPVEGDLLVLLGTVRGRLEPRLAQQGLHFEWQVSDIPPIPGFTPDKALHVLRIVQEAIANVLKHAKAKAVTIRTGTRPASESLGPAVFIEVADDGAGIATAAAAGRGLGNMRERAARIGARLDLDSNAQGTTVRLWLPLPQAA